MSLLLLMSRCLGKDVEVCVGEPISPDALEEPPEWGGIGHIRGLGLTRTACEHATDMAMDVGDYQAWITRFWKDSQLAVVVDYPPIHGGLVDWHVGEVVANDREDTVAEGGAGVEEKVTSSGLGT